MPEFLTTEQVARRYHVGTETVRRWQRSGYGPRAVKIGLRWLYSTEELARFDAEAAAEMPAAA
jgi:RimJ/RimL family protein N-acetyltransferase